MKRLLTTGLIVLICFGLSYAGPPDYPPNLPDDTAYDATTWDGNVDAATKNSIRDEFENVFAGNETFEHIVIVPSATRQYAIDIQGDTNDYTGANTMCSQVIARDVNRGTGNIIPDYAGWQSYLTLKHTDAVIAGDQFGYGCITRVSNQLGRLTNAGATDRQYWLVGTHSTVKDTGYYDTDDTGILNVKFVANYAWAWADGYDVLDTGGHTPANVFRAYGSEAKVENLPTGAGAATSTFVSAGFYADVTGNTTGTSTGYGLYINAVTGSDNNYGIWDNSGQDWVLDADNQDIYMGEDQTDYHFGWDGTDAVHTITAGAFAFNGGPTRLLHKYDGVSDAARTNTALTTDHIVGWTALTATRDYQISSEDIAVAGRTFIIKDEIGKAATFPITVSTEGSEKIDGADTITLNANYASVQLYSNGSHLFVY